MKLLHTADWHVGRAIRGRSRAEEHEAVLEQIAGVAAAEQVDAVLVVGDVFDTAAPTAESEQIVYRALLRLAETGATVVVLSGNHDNDRRLQAVAPLLSLGRVVCRPVFAPAAEGGVVELRSRDGRERALLACVPFLSQRYVVRAEELLGQDAGEHQLQYADRMRRIVEALTAGFTSRSDIHLLAAHCMVLGATLTGSERFGQSVFEYSVSAAAFPAHVQYVALGHLHRQQAVPGPVPAHYSGSPLALDFGEAGDAKGVLVVEVAAGQPARVRPVALTAGRRLRVVEGTLAELAQMEVGEDWVKAVMRDVARPGLADDVRAIMANAVDVVIPRPDAPGPDRPAQPRVGRSPHDLFADYLTVRGVDGAALTPLFAELLDDVMAAESAERVP